ncbi:MAG TPA: ammonium transporter [Stellaceae bacterium]|nr:ammonium transporter [Stellaceae bacterium]
MDHTFPQQVSTEAFLEAFFYMFACVGVLAGLLGLILLDVGLVQVKNVTDTIVQKIAGAMIGGVSFVLCGYAVWNLQFYQALGVPNPAGQAFADYWLFGTLLTTSSIHLDPATMPTADTQQIFAAFFFMFAGLTCALIHGAGVERMKAAPYYIMCVLSSMIFMPLLVYLTYGSGSILTNAGMHDFVGTYSLYLYVGTWGLVLAWKLGPRRHIAKAPVNIVALATGSLILMCGISMFVVGCGFVQPGHGYFGITTGDSSLGLTFVSLFLSFGGGGITGALIADLRKMPVYIILGPLAGYISCSALFDLAQPWETLLIGALGPVVMWLTEILVRRSGIDELKIAPLALGPGLLSCLAAGIIGAGTTGGGYFDVEKGAYAYHHAVVSIGMQALGIVGVVGGTAIVALIVVTILDRTIGLRVTPEQEEAGLDASFWEAPPNQPRHRAVAPARQGAPALAADR